MACDGRRRFSLVFSFLFFLAGGMTCFAGVARSIQEQYRQSYLNKAMVLKIPVYAERQFVYCTGKSCRIESGSGVPRYKIGDQLRVLGIDFSDTMIKFRLSGISTPGAAEINFKFDAELTETFANREIFNQALADVLTEGLKYSEIDKAKESFLEDQFERALKDLTESASVSRDAVFKVIAPSVPAYQDARREIDTLKNKVQDLSGQLGRVQSENRKMESQLKDLQVEAGRLRGVNAGLQDKMNASLVQMSRLGDELQDAKGSAQGYQRELANIQRSLNLKVDAGRDLAAQIGDIVQLIKKLQNEKDALLRQIDALQASLASQQTANAQLSAANAEMQSENAKLQATLRTLTSNKDSLAGQYMLLKNEKEKLDDFASAVRLFNTHRIEETTEGGVHYGKAGVYLKKVLIGVLEWRVPANLSQGESRQVEASFTAESIDTVQLTPEEKSLVRTLGDKFRMRMQLIAGAETFRVSSAQNLPVREIGERDRSAWEWVLANQGARGTRVLLTAHLVNRHSGEIPVFQQDFPVLSSGIMSRLPGSARLIPGAAGFGAGILLCVVILKLRPKKSAPGDASSSTHTTVKGL